MIQVNVYSRSACHLCEVAKAVLEKIQKEVGEAHPFDINVTLIDGNPELEREYGEQVPVIHINGQAHDFFRVDPAKFKKAIAALHPHQ